MMRRSVIRVLFFWSCVALGMAWLATAQPMTAESGRNDQIAGIGGQLQHRVSYGADIFVIDRQGRAIHGRVKRLSSTSLVLDINGTERQVAIRDIGRIEKAAIGLPGALVGGGLGGLVFALGSGASCLSDCRSVVTRVALAGAGLGALAGGKLNRAVSSRVVVYDADPNSTSDPVHAFADIWTRLQTGDIVYVVDRKGLETKGTFAGVESSSISVSVDGQLRDFPQADIREIARARRFALRGAMIGAGIGAVSGMTTAGGAGVRALFGASEAIRDGAIGAGIGALIRGRTIIYTSRPSTQSVQLTPLISPHGGGLFVSVIF